MIFKIAKSDKMCLQENLSVGYGVEMSQTSPIGKILQYHTTPSSEPNVM